MTRHTHDPARCRTLLGELNDYVDGALADELCAALESHLAACDDCRVVLDTLAKTVTLYQGLRDQALDLPPEVEQRLIAQVAARLAR